MRVLAAAVFAIVLALSAPMLAQGPRRDGKWEIKITMDMPGMPVKMPPVTTTQCVTKEEAADPQKAVPKSDRGGDCKISDYKVEGNKVTYSMKCEGKEPMTGTGEIVYSENAYTGTMKLDRQGMAMTMNYDARRVGDCAK